MLEIAVEIMGCLILVAIIAFALGYAVLKNKTKIEKENIQKDTDAKLDAQKALTQKALSDKEALQKDADATLDAQKALTQKALSDKETLQKDADATLDAQKALTQKALSDKEALQKNYDAKVEALKALEEEKEDLETGSEELAIESEVIEEVSEALEEIEKQEATNIPLGAIEPELLDEPRNGKRDDLTKIKGIGPKVQAKLNNFGIYHFSQIASWTENNILWLKENTSFANGASKDAWIEQAKFFQ